VDLLLALSGDSGAARRLTQIGVGFPGLRPRL